jgi:hypothetical protein
VDIWNSIKSAVGNILNSILSTFLNTFLKGILGALSGQKGAISSAFGAMFGGGGGGGGIPGVGGGLFGKIPGLGSLFGGGGGLTAGTGGLAAGFPGAGSVGGGAAGGGGFGIGGGAAAGIGGGLLAGGVGFGLGQMFQKFLGGAGWKAGGLGAASGAASGALIGSIVPGIGTAIGAAIGGLAGLLGGWIGKSQGEKVNDKRDEFFAMFGGKGTGPESGFGSVAAELAKLSAAAGGGPGGGDLFQALIKAKDMKAFETAVRNVQAALEGAEYATVKVAEATDVLTRQRNKAIEAGQTESDVLKEQAGAYSELVQAAQKSGAAIPEATRPILEQLIEMGLLIDGNGNKIEDLAGVKFPDLAGAAIGVLKDVDGAVERSGRNWEEYARRGGFVGQRIADGMDGLPYYAEQIADGIEDAFEGIKPKIQIEFKIPEIPGLPGEEPPGAAGGVMSRQPGLVIFGEGGETELGGPRSFFRDVFASLAAEGGGLGGNQIAAPAPLQIGPFNITAMSSADLKGAIERDVIPPILEALRVNRRGSLTDMKTILGVT